MLKFILFVSALIIATIICVHTTLQNGSLIRYLDAHPNPDIVPQVEYAAGHSYYLLGDLQDSATCFLRIPERYPKSPHADDAYYYYLQSLDDMNIPRQTMADMYQTYVDRYPDGLHVEMVTRRIMYCRNSR